MKEVKDNKSAAKVEIYVRPDQTSCRLGNKICDPLEARVGDVYFPSEGWIDVILDADGKFVKGVEGGLQECWGLSNPEDF